ncbi:MAG: hypothetical protein ACHQNT_05485 [Bacteroidia bacterium]
MARLIIPSEFILKTNLFALMKAKHTADGAGSILTPYLTENGINLVSDETRVTDAKTANTDFETFARDAEKLFKERNRLFAPVMKQHRKCVQFLKSLFKNNIGKLGDWGVTVNGKKIVYPVKVEDQIAAVVTFIDKHLSFPAGTSPLEGFLTGNPEINLTTNKANTLTAKTNHGDATQLNIDKETKRVERDALMEPITGHLTGIGAYIVDYFPANPNKAGDWGYTVDNSPQGTKVRVGFVNIGSAKVLNNLAIEGVLINNSEFDIEIFKGKVVSGTPVILQPGKPFLVVKGYGTATVRNPNGEKKAFYQGVFNP